MYWGSVKFFKHLILLIFFGSFAISIIFAIFWSVKYHHIDRAQQELQQQMEILQLENSDFMSALESLKNGSPEKFLAICEENGISADDALRALQEAINAQDSTTAFAEQSFTDGSDTTALPSYVTSYPNLYVATPVKVASPKELTIYLTFDNGPTPTTDRILDILEQYQVKATFFVTPAEDGSDAERLCRIRDAGHTLALRPTQNGKIVYDDVQGFLDAFAAASELLYHATGVQANIFRFPGGSINDYNRSISMDLISEMHRRGYVYFDWNVDCGQTDTVNTTAGIISNKMIQAAKNNNSTVVLLYDDWNCEATVDALANTIQVLTKQGYAFDRLTNAIKPVVFQEQSDVNKAS